MTAALVAFSKFELELFFKTYIAVMFTYIAPSMIFCIAVAATPADKKGVALSVMYPVVLGIIIVFVSFYTLATQVVGYREMGFYKRILVTNIRPISIALSNAIRGFILVLIGLALLSLQGWLVFGIRPSYNLFEGLIAILFAGGGLFLLGLIPACFIKRTQSMFAVASLCSYIMALFSGTVPPLGKWLAWVPSVSPAWPSFHALRLLNAGFSGNLFQAPALVSILYMTALIAICLFILRKHLSWT